MLDRKYQRYAQDTLAALIDEPSGCGQAAGKFIPYVRYELTFPENDTPPKPAGRYTDLVKGRISVDDFYKGSEIHEMAYAIRDAIASAVEAPEHQLIVEAVVNTQHNGIGQAVNFFIYSESHSNGEALMADLQANRQRIMANLSKLSENKGDLPPM